MFFRFFAIAVFCTFLAPGFMMSARAEDFTVRFRTAEPPQALPALLFEDAKGVSHDLGEYKSRYILLNLWATWCAPCVEEMPSLSKLRQELDERKIVFIALNEDRGGPEVAQAFYQKRAIANLPVFIDRSGRAPFVLKTPGMPVTILIDPAGKEIGRIEGEVDWTARDTVAFIKKKISN